MAHFFALGSGRFHSENGHFRRGFEVCLCHSGTESTEAEGNGDNTLLVSSRLSGCFAGTARQAPEGLKVGLALNDIQAPHILSLIQPDLV